MTHVLHRSLRSDPELAVSGDGIEAITAQTKRQRYVHADGIGDGVAVTFYSPVDEVTR